MVPTKTERSKELVGGSFLEEFYKELSAKIDLSAALPAYEDALKTFLRDNQVDLLILFERPSVVPDISPLRRTWEASNLYVLPDAFDWPGVAQRVTGAALTC